MVRQLGFLLIAISGLFAGTSSSQATEDIEINWEITNRFAPFEVLDEPSNVFRRYQIPAGDNAFERWHRELHANGGVESPYASRLRNGEPLHWDQHLGRHRQQILDFVQNENDLNTTIEVDLWVEGAADALCVWEFRDDAVPCVNNGSDNIRGVLHQVPLSGSSYSVEINGISHQVDVEPEHIVIVALGDSYGSGEGNPDVPTEWLDVEAPAANQTRWLIEQNRIASPPPNSWIDDQCHRSFYSHQSLTALKLASDDSHAFVSFLHYACTGAEIFDGLLAPQYKPWNARRHVPLSQVNAAILDLCQVSVRPYEAVSGTELGGVFLADFYRRGSHAPVDGAGDTSLRPGDAFDEWIIETTPPAGVLPPGLLAARSGLLSCPNLDDNLRVPDHVFISASGNDIGFAELVHYGIGPVDYKTLTATRLLMPTICPAEQYRVSAALFPNAAEHCRLRGIANGYHTGDLIRGSGAIPRGGLAERYGLLFRIIEARLGVDRSDIVMPQYPDPLRDRFPNSASCEPLESNDEFDMSIGGNSSTTPRDYDRLSPWNGLKIVAHSYFRVKFNAILNRIEELNFNLTTIGDESEASNILGQFRDFRAVFASTAIQEGITFVCETRDAFVGYGWWLGEYQNLPSHETQSDRNQRWDVVEWDPYAFSLDTRAIRTGNDSVLTQLDHEHPDRSISGTVHPNLTGHRLIAQIVSDRVQSDR